MIIAFDIEVSLCSLHRGKYNRSEHYCYRIEVVGEPLASVCPAKGSFLAYEAKAKQLWEEVRATDFLYGDEPCKPLILGTPTFDPLIYGRVLNSIGDGGKHLNEVLLRLNVGESG